MAGETIKQWAHGIANATGLAFDGKYFIIGDWLAGTLNYFDRDGNLIRTVTGPVVLLGYLLHCAGRYINAQAFPLVASSYLYDHDGNLVRTVAPANVYPHVIYERKHFLGYNVATNKAGVTNWDGIIIDVFTPTFVDIAGIFWQIKLSVLSRGDDTIQYWSRDGINILSYATADLIHGEIATDGKHIWMQDGSNVYMISP